MGINQILSDLSGNISARGRVTLLDDRIGGQMKQTARTRKPSSTGKAAVGHRRRGVTGRILIVDDDSDMRSSIAEVLEDQGYQVVTAANGQEALTKISRMVPPPDMILLDLSMPVMNGAQFVEQLSQDPYISGVPVVLFSGELNLRHHAQTLDASAYLKKPVDPQRLLALASRFSPIH